MNTKRNLGSIGLLLLSLLLVASPSGAQKSLSDGVEELAAKLAKSYGDGQRGKVAIVPLRELGGGENLLGTYIAETLTNSFFEAGYRDIVERQMLDRALQELKLSLTGMIDGDSAKKIGKFLHADLVVGGTMTDLGGEVSVNCRMFAVETGQVVAVAATKIVKDDSVKSMLPKKVAASGGNEKSGAPDAEPEPSGETVQEAQGISFHLKSCSRRGTTVRCELSVTALDDDAKIHLYRESRLVDAKGNETATSIVSFSGTSSLADIPGYAGHELQLVRGVARTGYLGFEGVEAAGGQVPLIEIRFSGILSPGGATREVRDVRIQFRNVKVK
ncbi:MAG TPA: FlgO family outer membrane protein [Thermoanaerobaculia bacterium]|nr:FlgO family outer membrane protein [Thermoanaerobaculia bacterium]